jgi:CubicO group peptidase (beta-lactamase class C family)
MIFCMKHRYRVLFAISGLAALLACNSAEPISPVPIPFPSGPAEGGSNYPFFVGSYIDSLMEANQIQGLAIGMIREGRIDWEQTYGLADVEQRIEVDPSTRFRLGPASQLMTTVAVLQFAALNGLNLDADIRPLLPFTLKHARFPMAGISLRMLLSHVSGFRDRPEVLDTLYREGDPMVRLRGVLENYFTEEGLYYSTDNFTDTRPGKSYQYARVNVALAAYLVEILTGIDFDVYCKTKLFQQLGYTSVSWFLSGLSLNQVAVPYQLAGGVPLPQPRIGSPLYPSGQLRISLEYLHRFWHAMINGAVYDGRPLISPATLAEMETVHYPFANATQALGWRYDTLGNRPLLGLQGSELGVSARMYMEPEKQQGVVILSNGDWYEEALDSLTVQLLLAADKL